MWENLTLFSFNFLTTSNSKCPHIASSPDHRITWDEEDHPFSSSFSNLLFESRPTMGFSCPLLQVSKTFIDDRHLITSQYGLHETSTVEPFYRYYQSILSNHTYCRSRRWEKESFLGIMPILPQGPVDDWPRQFQLVIIKDLTNFVKACFKFGPGLRQCLWCSFGDCWVPCQGHAWIDWNFLDPQFGRGTESTRWPSSNEVELTFTRNADALSNFVGGNVNLSSCGADDMPWIDDWQKGRAGTCISNKPELACAAYLLTNPR